MAPDLHRYQQQMMNQRAHPLRRFALRQIQQLQRLQHIVGQRRQRIETLISRQLLTRRMMQLEVAQQFAPPPLPIALEPMLFKRPLRFAHPIIARQKRLPP